MSFWDFCLVLIALCGAVGLGFNVGHEKGVKEGRILGFRETQNDLSKYLAHVMGRMGITREQGRMYHEEFFALDQDRLAALVASYDKKG